MAEEKVQMELDQKLLKAGLSVQIVVVRGDGKVVSQFKWDKMMARLIGSFIQLLPKKMLGQDKRDHDMMMLLNQAGLEEKKRLLSIGLKPWVWK